MPPSSTTRPKVELQSFWSVKAYNFHIAQFFLKFRYGRKRVITNDPFKSTGGRRIKDFPVQLKCLIDT